MRLDAGAHAPTCAIHAERVRLLTDLLANPGDPYLLGAMVEYYGFGDQEAEICTCGWSPEGALASAILGAGDDTDYTDVLETMQPFVSPQVFKRLAAAMDACPIHCCDIRICLDDEVHGMEVYE